MGWVLYVISIIFLAISFVNQLYIEEKLHIGFNFFVWMANPMVLYSVVLFAAGCIVLYLEILVEKLSNLNK